MDPAGTVGFFPTWLVSGKPQEKYEAAGPCFFYQIVNQNVKRTRNCLIGKADVLFCLSFTSGCDILECLEELKLSG